MAKSVTSLLIRIAVDEGRLGSVEDPLRRYLPTRRGATTHASTTARTCEGLH